MMRLIASVLLMLTYALPGQAQTSRHSIDSPACMMSQDVDLAYRLTSDYTHELFIWHWYAYGFPQVGKVPNFVNNQDKFAPCLDKASGGKCGWKSDKGVQKALKISRSDIWGKKPLKTFYGNGLPPEAVKFAMRSLGTCFGNDPALPTLDDVGLAEGEFDIEACKELADQVESFDYYKNVLPAELADYQSWGVAFNKYMTKRNEHTPLKACRVVPKAALPYLAAYPERKRQEQLARDKEQLAFDNRPVAKRIAGLDAFAITYSLVSRTLSGEHAATRPLPAGADEWLNSYIKEVAGGGAEPAIPEAVQQWAVEQPLDRFEPLEDPFEQRKRLRPYEISEYVWSLRVKSLMDKAAPNEPRVSVREGCSILWGYAWGDINFGKRIPQTPGEVEFYRLVQQTPDKMAWTMCEETPTGIFQAAQARYDREQYEASLPPKPNAWDEINRALAEAANRPSTIKQPYKAPTTRCYITGETLSGLANQVCFTN